LSYGARDDSLPQSIEGPRGSSGALPLRSCRDALKVVADTGPLVAAANRRDRAHALASALVTELGRRLLVPESVIVEVDRLLRSRVGGGSARLFLGAIFQSSRSTSSTSARRGPPQGTGGC